MKDNPSLALSLAIKQRLAENLMPAFSDILPVEILDDIVKQVVTEENIQYRDKVYTPCRTAMAMILTSVQEDKSLQNTVDIFNSKFTEDIGQSKKYEQEILQKEKEEALKRGKKTGRPKLYKSKIGKGKTNPLSGSTVAYNNARKRLPVNILQKIFDYTGTLSRENGESWHGFHTYITDGTYLQLQDTESIRQEFPPVENSGMFPQALLQVFIRQGSGNIASHALGSREQSELQLVIPMLKGMQAGDLLLADDLYNTYYNFCLLKQQSAHIIVPGKRKRNYKVIKKIAGGDEIVSIGKSKVKPDYVEREEWNELPDNILLRRLVYKYQTKKGMEEAVLYSTVLDGEIEKTEIVLKYASRWDIEICIREIKTLMDINVLRAKTPPILKKELLAALTGYNLVRKIISQSAGKAGFSPQKNIFQEFAEAGRPLLLDKKGRVYSKRSPGRPKGFAVRNIEAATSGI